MGRTDTTRCREDGKPHRTTKILSNARRCGSRVSVAQDASMASALCLQALGRALTCALRPSSPDQSLTLPKLRPTFGRKLLNRERGSARHCGLNLLAHLSLGRSGTPLRGGGVLFRHAASLSGMSQLTACAISTSQGTRSGSGRGMRPSANTLASSMRFLGKVQGAGRSPPLVGQPSPLGSLLE